MYLTGRPDPTCGLTRTFAWMWRGDIGQAVRVYPLGPALFMITFGLVLYYGSIALTGRPKRFNLPATVRRTLVVIGLTALVLNWTAKLLWLGM